VASIVLECDILFLLLKFWSFYKSFCYFFFKADFLESLLLEDDFLFEDAEVLDLLCDLYYFLADFL
jgi:hypothetical protein